MQDLLERQFIALVQEDGDNLASIWKEPVDCTVFPKLFLLWRMKGLMIFFVMEIIVLLYLVSFFFFLL